MISSNHIFSLLVVALHVCRGATVPYNGKRQASTVPSYVNDYGKTIILELSVCCSSSNVAPLVWLQSQDPYFPSDIGAQLQHTKPEVNFIVVPNAPNPLTLNNLDTLNSAGANVYLTSVDDVTKRPAWLKGVKPNASGKTDGAVSSAIIVNDHGAGHVDAFYMYFYAYNFAPPIFGQDVGDVRIFPSLFFHFRDVAWVLSHVLEANDTFASRNMSHPPQTQLRLAILTPRSP